MKKCDYCAGGWTIYGRCAHAVALTVRRLTKLVEWLLVRHCRKCGCEDCRAFLVMRTIAPLLAQHGRRAVPIERRPS